MGKGGEIYVFDMGKPVKIAHLARKMILLSGYEPNVDIKIEYTGLRDGEKLYEELLGNGEFELPTHHSKIKIARLPVYDFDRINKELDYICKNLIYKSNMDIVSFLKKEIPEFLSNNSIYELLDNDNPLQEKHG
ncbi:MAG TPA: polysaccharide biosynthesis protein, partial [Sphingobacteriaceae bacterium]|nr:polysaccharide biosynthesis protein [Sphingobacteriaceae bacterium]